MSNKGDKVFFVEEDLSVYFNNKVFQFKCNHCRKKLFTNNQLEGLYLSIEDIFHLIINPKYLDPDSLKFNKDDIQFKDSELKEEDSIYHPVKCKQCDTTVGKFILATPLHKSFFQDKIIVNSKFLLVEMIIFSDDNFCEMKVIDFAEVIRKNSKNLINKESEDDNLKGFKESVKLLYDLSKNNSEFIEFKKAVTTLNSDFDKLTEIDNFLNNEDPKSKLV